jgi:formate-dependent nitrite reductase membrane component NrfD
MALLHSMLAHTLWVLGISGVLATGSYLQWHRTAYERPWRFVVRTPRFLFPLCLNIALICVGAALSGSLGVQPDARWSTYVWGGLALLFAGQSVLYAHAGDRHGWDTPTEGE